MWTFQHIFIFTSTGKLQQLHRTAYAGKPCHRLRGAAMTPAALPAGLAASRLGVPVTTATSSLEAGPAGAHPIDGALMAKRRSDWRLG